MSILKCILFDFFGTLAEYDGKAFLFSEMNIPLKRFLDNDRINEFDLLWESTYNSYLSSAVISYNEFSMYDITDKMNENFTEVPKYILRDIVDIYMSCWQKNVHVCKDTLELIPILSSRYKLGIISNTHYPNLVPNILNSVDLKEYFCSIILSVEIGRRKPCKSIFQHSLHNVGVESKDCCFIGDSFEEDIIGARNAGIPAIQINRGNLKVNNAETIYINNLYDLEPLINFKWRR